MIQGVQGEMENQTHGEEKNSRRKGDVKLDCRDGKRFLSREITR